MRERRHAIHEDFRSEIRPDFRGVAHLRRALLMEGEALATAAVRPVDERCELRGLRVHRWQETVSI